MYIKISVKHNAQVIDFEVDSLQTISVFIDNIQKLFNIDMSQFLIKSSNFKKVINKRETFLDCNIVTGDCLEIMEYGTGEI